MAFPSYVVKWMSGQGDRIADIGLLEIETVDGQRYFLTDFEGNYPSVMTGAMQAFTPWLKSAGPFTMTSDFRTDAGDIVLQDLSGNQIQRDVSGAIAAHEFENAIAIFRCWLPLADYAIYEQHGTLKGQVSDGGTQMTFRMVQTFDTQQYNLADDPYASTCTWLFKGKKCGSTSGNATCAKTIAACVTNAARERFNASPTPPPGYLYSQPVTIGASGVGGSGRAGGECFTGNTKVKLWEGPVRFDELPQGSEFFIVNRWGERRTARLIVHEDKERTLVNMGDGELVKREHMIDLSLNEWRPASCRFKQATKHKGRVYNLTVLDAVDWNDRHFVLENGEIAHNSKISPGDGGAGPMNVL